MYKLFGFLSLVLLVQIDFYSCKAYHPHYFICILHLLYIGLVSKVITCIAGTIQATSYSGAQLKPDTWQSRFVNNIGHRAVRTSKLLEPCISLCCKLATAMRISSLKANGIRTGSLARLHKNDTCTVPTELPNGRAFKQGNRR